MRKNRLLLIAIALVVVAIGTVTLAPFVISNGLHFWLRWQAHRQHLKIDHGRISAPFLRPIAIDHLHITSESASATQIDINTQQLVLHPRLASIVTGRANGIRTMSIKAMRAEIRRDYAGDAKSNVFDWAALQKLLPANFDISHLDARIENGPTVVLLLNAAISASQIESGRFSAGEFTVTSPLIRDRNSTR